jgi:hypothetical protein
VRRGASAAWVEDDGSIHREHAKSMMRNTILDMMEMRRERVRHSDVSIDELAMVAREEIAAAMVRGDFAASSLLTDLLHDMAQVAADTDSTR